MSFPGLRALSRPASAITSVVRQTSGNGNLRGSGKSIIDARPLARRRRRHPPTIGIRRGTCSMPSPSRKSRKLAPRAADWPGRGVWRRKNRRRLITPQPPLRLAGNRPGRAGQSGRIGARARPRRHGTQSGAGSLFYAVFYPTGSTAYPVLHDDWALTGIAARLAQARRQ